MRTTSNPRIFLILSTETPNEIILKKYLHQFDRVNKLQIYNPWNEREEEVNSTVYIRVFECDWTHNPFDCGMTIWEKIRMFQVRRKKGGKSVSSMISDSEIRVEGVSPYQPHPFLLRCHSEGCHSICCKLTLNHRQERDDSMEQSVKRRNQPI